MLMCASPPLSCVPCSVNVNCCLQALCGPQLLLTLPLPAPTELVTSMSTCKSRGTWVTALHTLHMDLRVHFAPLRCSALCSLTPAPAGQRHTFISMCPLQTLPFVALWIKRVAGQGPMLGLAPGWLQAEPLSKPADEQAGSNGATVAEPNIRAALDSCNCTAGNVPDHVMMTH